VRKIDLNGDGRYDYLVDLHDTTSTGRAVVFCGAGGCNLVILVAKPNGDFIRVFDDRAIGYEIGDDPALGRSVLPCTAAIKANTA
jgi:hypothetical protein